MNPMIEKLAAAPRLNYWLGPGCSDNLRVMKVKDILAMQLTRFPSNPAPATLEDLFVGLEKDRRANFVNNNFRGMDWTYPCLAALTANGRTGVVVMRNIDGLLPRLLAARDLMPPVLSELGDSDETNGSGTVLYELPVVRDPERWRSLTSLADPWVVVGVDKPRENELALLKQFSAPIHWVPLWNQKASMGTAVPGFDPASFFLALAQAAMGHVPERLIAIPFDPGNIDEALTQVSYADIQALREAGKPATEISRTALEGLHLLDNDAFHARLRDYDSAERKLRRLSPDYPNHFMIVELKAKESGGRRADTLLEMAQAGLETAPLPQGSGRVRTADHRELFRAKQWVDLLGARAKLRRPAEAEPFYRKAYDQIKAFPLAQPKDWLVTASFADFLMDWSAAKDLKPAAALLEEGLEILQAALSDPHLKPINHATMWIRQANMLRKHAGRLDKDASQPFYERARACCSPLEDANNKFMAEYTLGTLAFEQARKLVEREEQLVADGERHFEAARTLKEGSPALLFLDWGTAYGNVAQDRTGAQADHYFTRVFQTFERAAQDAQNLDQIHHNWGGFQLIQARTKTGDEREHLLEQAWSHAMEAEVVSPTMGAYNLACIAAERRDWDTMAHWLRISARGARFPGPSHTDQVTSFNEVRNERWFQELLRELYPTS